MANVDRLARRKLKSLIKNDQELLNILARRKSLIKEPKVAGYTIEYKAKEDTFWRHYLFLDGSLNSAMEELEARRGNAPLRQWRLIEKRVLREYE